MSRSGVKGTAIESIVEDINRLVEEGAIAYDVLEARMSAQDMGILESKIQAALWYPLDSFGRMTALLLEHEGNGDPAYLRDRGRRAAERIVASGIYSQISAGAVETYGDRVGRVMVTLGPAMYRDSEWTHDSILEPGGKGRVGFRVVMTSPVEFPDVCRHSTQGFIEFLTEQAIDEPYVLTSGRPEPTRVVFDGRRR